MPLFFFFWYVFSLQNDIRANKNCNGQIHSDYILNLQNSLSLNRPENQKLNARVLRYKTFSREFYVLFKMVKIYLCDVDIVPVRRCGVASW